MNRMLLTAGLVSALARSAAAAPPAAAEELHALFRDRLEWQHREFPQTAMARGDYRYADRLADESLEAMARRQAAMEEFLRRLRAVDRAALDAEDRLNRDLCEWELRTELGYYRFRVFLMPLGPQEGPHRVVGDLHAHVRFERPADYANYVQRLEQVPRLIDEFIARMRLGLAEGRTPPRAILAGVPAEFAALLDGGQIDALARPLEVQPGVPEAQAAALRQRYRERAGPAVRAALAKLRAFVVDEYIPGCRASLATSDLPDGPEYYAFELERYTTTPLTADEIHALGLREVERIRAEMLAVIRRTDFMDRCPAEVRADDARLRAAFLEYLRSDPRFYATSPAELLRGYRDICKRIDAELPRLFGVLPRLTFGVRPIPDYQAPTAPTAHFYPGDIRNAQSSTFYVNTCALDQRPTYEMIPLALHEAVPGHHFQSSLARELEGVPEFRRHLWVQSFGEGWALYAERLGLELGLYTDPYDDFGRLLMEMWRACRLVVDTGLHARGWSRAQAVAYLLENSGLSEHNIRAEVDRYIAWPGQATAYKVGELRIRELRARAEQALGERFDLRAFHDMLLGAGTLPLGLLEQRVDAWIAARAAGTP